MPHPLVPHHDGSPLYVSTQTPSLGERVRVRLRVPEEMGRAASVWVRSNPNREPSYTEAFIVATAHGWDWWEAEFPVENPVHGYRFLIVFEDSTSCWVNNTGLHPVETRDLDDFKLITYPAPPEWARSSILYQIFPDRFARSAQADERPTPDWAIPAEWRDPVDLEQPGREKQFYGGDLDGIREHLDHLVDLGVTMIYLTPVFPGRSNHRYDASSFGHIDPMLGGDEAFIRLVEAAHERGLRVIGDLTSNHSGDGHEWFRAALGTPDALEAAFFHWLNEEHTEYVSWLGVPSLPKFNWTSGELRDRFIEGLDSVVARWLQPPYNLDGWRIDVANMTGRYLDQDLNEEVRKTIRSTMIAVNPDTILIGESTNDASSDFQGDAWHGAMTYTNFTRPLWSWLSEPGSPAAGGIGFALGRIPPHSGVEFYEAHNRFTAGFPWRVRLSNMNPLDTHDTPRFATHAIPGAVPVALGMAVTLPGIPVVFAGDEFGLTGEDGEASRTPIPWQEEDAAADRISLYRDLIHLKREHPALNGGGMRWLYVADDVLAYVRESAEECVLVVAARADFEVTLDPSAVSGASDAIPLFGAITLADGPAGLWLSGAGPAFGAWQLPGIHLPDFARF